MLTNMHHWEVASLADKESGLAVSKFGDRYGLTARETELLRALVLFGLRNEEMGAMFHIAQKTVKNHMACMMGKTRTRSSRELQALFLRYILNRQTMN
ncbi:LuxR C-terminal-related transcriptional regulator [Cohnella panacarvi]|uniref:LuxR C-terminal-related transcriptional regulator n=1 Tax=Cohnella panacarvi TaxID=400776 RepID=UPI000479653C|nr:LuxR C-terminal-related transcriptional regulator [Cohnella panacarvi]